MCAPDERTLPPAHFPHGLAVAIPKIPNSWGEHGEKSGFISAPAERFTHQGDRKQADWGTPGVSHHGCAAPSRAEPCP